jgi:kynurenine formamidase
VTDVADLSHPIRDGMATYPGLPRPVVDFHLEHAASRPRYANRAEFAIGRLEMVGNTGTYLDSPFHRYPDGADVGELPLARLVDLPTVVVDATEQVAAGRRLDLVLPASQALTGRAVLVRTGWDRRWGDNSYWEPGPYLGPVTLEQLVHASPAVVGVDFWNIDDPDDPIRPVHTQLLGAGTPVVEHLTRLEQISTGARTFFVPLAVHRAPSVPVRAFAIRPPDPSSATGHPPQHRGAAR